MSRTERFHEGRTEQLRMFMPVDEIINTVHKGDSAHAPGGGKAPWSPKDQWAKPGKQHFSLKDIKLGAAKNRGVGYDQEGPRDGRTGHPLGEERKLHTEVAAGRSKPLGIYSRPGREPVLADGHHRLAMHEHLGHQFAAVEHRNRPVWGDLGPMYKNDKS